MSSFYFCPSSSCRCCDDDVTYNQLNQCYVMGNDRHVSAFICVCVCIYICVTVCISSDEHDDDGDDDNDAPSDVVVVVDVNKGGRWMF